MAHRLSMMALFSRDPASQAPPRRSRRHLLAYLIALFLALHVLHTPPPAPQAARARAWFELPLPIWRPAAPDNARHRAARADPGHTVRLGTPSGTLAAAWTAALFGGRDLTVPSCLTQPPPAAPAGATDAALPVRDDLPGFYGAPWTGHVGGDLVALLHVYAPRSRTAPVDAPTLQIYRHYNGRQVAPSFAAVAPAAVYRGSRAVLYRAYPGGPVTCLDLVVPRGQSQGTAYLYYREDHHYFERTARFAIQK